MSLSSIRRPEVTNGPCFWIYTKLSLNMQTMISQCFQHRRMPDKGIFKAFSGNWCSISVPRCCFLLEQLIQSQILLLQRLLIEQKSAVIGNQCQEKYLLKTFVICKSFQSTLCLNFVKHNEKAKQEIWVMFFITFVYRNAIANHEILRPAEQAGSHFLNKIKDVCHKSRY